MEPSPTLSNTWDWWKRLAHTSLSLRTGESRATDPEAAAVLELASRLDRRGSLPQSGRCRWSSSAPSAGGPARDRTFQVNPDLAAEEVQALYVFRARLENRKRSVAACRLVIHQATPVADDAGNEWISLEPVYQLAVAEIHRS